MSPPLVTVITGFYNRGPLLARSLDSLLNQSLRDLQIVVFDDGSTDDTAARLDAYRDPRLLKINHNPNIGFVAGMIDAISRTQSKYIAVHGSGDVSLPTRLEKQAALLEARPEIGLVGCYYTNIVEEHNLRRPRRPQAEGMTLERLLKGNVFSHGEVMYRREVYEKAGGYAPEFKFNQDYDLWLRMIRHTNFATVPEFLYDRYVQFNDGVSYKPDKFIIQKRLNLMAKKLALLTPQEQAPLRARIMAGEIEQLVELTDPRLQKSVLFACLRLIAFGNLPQAREMAEKYLKAPGLRLFYQMTDLVFASPLGRPACWSIRRALGIRG